MTSKCKKCDMPIDDEKDSCSCEDNVCQYCCECEPDCDCGCQEDAI